MQKKFTTLFMLCAAVLSIALTGCSAGNDNRTDAAPLSLTGVAASGAPIIGAVSLQDSSEPAQARVTTTAGNGSYAVDVTGLTPPFILKVEWTDNTGHRRMYSFVEEPGTANINPFSNVVFAGAAGIPDQVMLAHDLDPALVRSVAARHREVMESLQAALAPLFELYQTSKNPITDAFEADHTGLDAMFDDVRIFVSGGMVIVRNNHTSELIFNGPVANIASGTFNPQCMPNVQATGAAADGAALYASKCGSCHGQLATSRKKGRTAAQIQSAISGNAGGMGFLSTLTAAEVQAIADALATTSTPPSTPPTTPATTDGAALYAANCGSCHGQLATSRKKGRTADQIESAISGNTGGMGFLSNLTSAEVQAIADALATAPTPQPSPTPTPTPAPTDGAALYAANCGSCHGQLATSRKKGRTADQIQSAISGNTGGMGFLANLTSAEVQAIADALATAPTPQPSPTPTPTPAPTDGAALYAANCGSCHGQLATSRKKGRTADQIQSAISGNTGGMGFLANLTSAEVQAIADALATTPTPQPTPTPTPAPTDGTALYADNCGSCHGQLATSSKKGRTATQIQSAISGNTGGMGFLSTLTTAEVQAIADVLVTTPAPEPSPTPTPLDGAVLYASWCGSCHGVLASSTKLGRTAEQIQAAITNNAGGMGTVLNLTTEQIQAIATALATTSPTPTPTCGSCHAIPPGTGQHSRHVNSEGYSCSRCHGTGYSSTTVNAATHQNGTVNIVSTIGWNATTRSCSNSCHGTHSWGGTAPAPTPTPVPTDGASLYTTYCSSCHGALATSSKAGRTAAQIQSAITGNTGGMGNTTLRALTTTQIQAIATALGTVAPSPTPTPTPTCGSCHSIPPGTGHHSTHRSRSCSTCHGTGYSSTTVNSATHNNGTINIASGSTPGWNPSTRSCSNSCHGTERW